MLVLVILFCPLGCLALFPQWLGMWVSGIWKRMKTLRTSFLFRTSLHFQLLRLWWIRFRAYLFILCWSGELCSRVFSTCWIKTTLLGRWHTFRSNVYSFVWSRSAITEFLPFFNSLLQRCKYSICNKDALKVYTIYLPQKCTKEMIRICWLDGDSSTGGSGFVVYLADSNVQLFSLFFTSRTYWENMFLVILGFTPIRKKWPFRFQMMKLVLFLQWMFLTLNVRESFWTFTFLFVARIDSFDHFHKENRSYFWSSIDLEHHFIKCTALFPLLDLWLRFLAALLRRLSIPESRRLKENWKGKNLPLHWLVFPYWISPRLQLRKIAFASYYQRSLLVRAFYWVPPRVVLVHRIDS